MAILPGFERDINPEMGKLRELLTELGVYWWDDSERDDFYDSLNKGSNFKRQPMQRTKWANGGSVIFGTGSHGYELGLLEAYAPGGGEPLENLTAEQVIDLWKLDFSSNPKEYSAQVIEDFSKYVDPEYM